MTVNTTNITAGPFVGNDITTAFPYAFRIELKTQIAVYSIEVTTAIETLLVVDTDYTVSGIGIDGGGNVTLVAGPLATGFNLFMTSDYSDTQDTSFSSQGAFFPAIHESAFDKLTFMFQQVLDRLTRRSLQFSNALSRTEDQNTLPTPIEGNILFWDSAGKLANVLPSLSGASLSAAGNVLSFPTFALLRVSELSPASVFCQDGVSVNDELHGHFMYKSGAAPGTYVDDNLDTIVQTSNDGSAGYVRKAPLGAATVISEAHLQNNTFTAFTTTGTAPAFVLTPSPAIAAAAANQSFKVKFHMAGVAANLAISGEAAKDLKQYDATGAKIDAVITANFNAIIHDDGTDYVVLNSLTPVIIADPINWTGLEAIGSAFSLGFGTTSDGAVARLTSTDIAWLDKSVESLRTYRFNGGLSSINFSLVGSGFSIAGIGNCALCRLTDTEVAFIDDTLEMLRVYSFSGTVWSEIGTGFSIPGINWPSLTRLDDDTIAFVDSTLEELRTYRRSAGVWSLVGSGLSIPGIGTPFTGPESTALSSTDIAIFDVGLLELGRYTFDESNWSLVGSALSIIAGATSLKHAITALNDSDVSLYIQQSLGDDIIQVYRFAALAWSTEGPAVTMPVPTGDGAMCSMNGTDVTFYDGQTDSLRYFRHTFSLGAGPYID